jgi:pyruvate/2-oxoglutarate dehydrogenase complex dihydrolipoamide dehydrogenase (E3) component
MVSSARIAHLVGRAADYGVNVGNVEIDLSKIRKRKRDIVESWSSGSQESLEAIDNIDLFFGTGRFSSTTEVEVELNAGGSELLSAKHIFINTGTRPLIPPIDGLNEVPYLDNESVMELGEVPEHLLVFGGGYIGLEFGQMFHRFGSKVTVVQRDAQLLGREDSDVAEAVLEILRDEGMEILLSAEAIRAERDGNGVCITIKTPDGEQRISGSHVLVGAGRLPNSDDLNLAAAGVDVDARGFIKSNEKLETTAPGIFVIGDVKGGPQFTHISYDDFRVIRTNLLNGGDASIKDRLVPYAVFIDPQLGRVGITEAEAKSQGLNYRVGKLRMAHVARAIEVDETRGFMKAIVDSDTGLILGAAVLGIEGGEVMSVLQMAMMGEVPYTTIKDGVFAHPTLAESLNNLFMVMDK